MNSDRECPMSLNERTLFAMPACSRRVMFAVLGLCVVGGIMAQAGESESPFRGKTVRIVVGAAAGGGFDAYSRLVAAHIARNLPGNPTVIVQNMTGAGSLLAANYIANVAPKDGTVIGMVNPGIVTDSLFLPDRFKFNARKMKWIGNALRETHVATAWHTSPITSFDQVFQSDFLVVNVPPRSRTGGVDEYLNQMNLVAQQLRSSPIRRVVFISSTAVYPDLNKTVGENDGDPSSALYIAEQIFLNMKSRTTTVIRFAGLVGPGRHPGRFLSGKEVGGATTPVNIIHLDDCVAITRKILKAKINEHMVFNACADLHPTRKEFYAKMAELLRVPAPFFNDSVAAFKIVDSSRLKKFLNYEFIYNDPMQMDFQ